MNKNVILFFAVLLLISGCGGSGSCGAGFAFGSLANNLCNSSSNSTDNGQVTLNSSAATIGSAFIVIN